MEDQDFGEVTWSNMNEYLVWLSQKELKEKKEREKNASDKR